ncbi:DinB family protein [Halobacillus amylolyticus]|uniref:DinB family protein n=1 Tax=Halobacillus amylolyticus TaxID=2932259 RepID=A0ABY4HDE4_9BACI|nr:DinB family protein [Halobacillus amylolyticus]UOR12831.1 DinB family protein [Halobacillus amylolyticus]
MSSYFFQNGLHGEDAHVDPLSVFEGLQWEVVGKKPEECPHSVWQILNHMIFWQDFILDYLKGTVPNFPDHAEESWPGGTSPSNETEWNDAVFKFSEGLKEAENEAKKDLEERGFGKSEGTRGDFLVMLVNHNSYHTGQVALTRRIIGEWPPPSGGDTW